MHDLAVNLMDRPGSLARMSEVLGDAGINIEGMCGVPVGGSGLVHLLVQDAGAARQALGDAGIECGGQKDVEVMDIVDAPGELSRHLRRVASMGVNVDLVYLATNTRLVLGSDDMAGLRSALHSESGVLA
jgi:hypothetical protein